MILSLLCGNGQGVAFGVKNPEAWMASGFGSSPRTGRGIALQLIPGSVFRNIDKPLLVAWQAICVRLAGSETHFDCVVAVLTWGEMSLLDYSGWYSIKPGGLVPGLFEAARGLFSVFLCLEQALTSAFTPVNRIVSSIHPYRNATIDTFSSGRAR